MNSKLHKLLLLAALVLPVMASAQTIEQMADIFWNKTSCLELTEERRAAMNKMQTYVDSFTHTLFNEYMATPARLGMKEKSLVHIGPPAAYLFGCYKNCSPFPLQKQGQIGTKKRQPCATCTPEENDIYYSYPIIIRRKGLFHMVLAIVFAPCKG